MVIQHGGEFRTWSDFNRSLNNRQANLADLANPARKQVRMHPCSLLDQPSNEQGFYFP